MNHKVMQAQACWRWEGNDVPFSDAEMARKWMDQLMEKARCDL